MNKRIVIVKNEIESRRRLGIFFSRECQHLLALLIGFH